MTKKDNLNNNNIIITRSKKRKLEKQDNQIESTNKKRKIKTIPIKLPTLPESNTFKNYIDSLNNKYNLPILPESNTFKDYIDSLNNKYNLPDKLILDIDDPKFNDNLEK
jgi:hypothetical protein